MDYMGSVKFNSEKILDFVAKESLSNYIPKGNAALEALKSGSCKGSEFLGWLHLPSSYKESELEEIAKVAEELRARTNVVVVIGIGGSYLGAKAVIEALSGSFDNYSEREMKVIFAGHNISEDYYHELITYLADKEFGICVISKSGTTTEPAIGFRLMKELLEAKVGKEEAGRRIIAITDASKGALRTLADKNGYKTFVIPDNVGGRFSVLTPVGLLPIALAGFDIKSLIHGAADAERSYLSTPSNEAVEYAACRNALYGKGYSVEILANFNPKLHYITEWWKQLFGESEGKEGRGIFPAGCDFTTDLHSMGQYIQDGKRMLMESVLSVESSKYRVLIPSDGEDLDKLNFLAGKRIEEVNKMAELGTRLAHVDGGVPNMMIEIEKIDEERLGELLYFFELACGVSGVMCDINTFDQPGVEAYKRNMFALLNKPGYEAESEAIHKKLKM